MTVPRALGVAALVAVVAVVALYALRGGDATRYEIVFQNAGQLVKGDEVQVGGRAVGTVDDIELTRDNQAQISVSVRDEAAPLHEGTTAIIRASSLSGVANRYISLSPGPNSARALGDGATLAADRTTTPVDLDQLFATFDAPTRKALDDVIAGSATSLRGVGKQANEAARYFNPALSSTSQLVNQLAGDQRAFNAFVSNTAEAMTALAERRDDLSGLVANAGQTASAIASQDASLDQALTVLPRTLRRANTTFVNLRATLGDLDALVAESKPATKRLAPFLAVLRPLVADARPTVADLRQLVSSAGDGDDLTDLLRQAPALERSARTALPNSTQALQKATPVLSFVRPYSPDFVGWLRDFGQTNANYDANGHFARVQPIFNAFGLDGNVLSPKPNLQRNSVVAQGQYRRCPGAATQPPQDGSAPYRDVDGKLDCDPTQVIPGS